MSDKMGKVVARFRLWSFLDEEKRRAGRVTPMEEECLVDTGATNVVIPPRVAVALGLTPAGTTTVTYADGRRETRDVVMGLCLETLGRVTECRAIVEPGRVGVLVGQIALEDMDLLVDCKAQQLVPRDPATHTTEIVFAQVARDLP